MEWRQPRTPGRPAHRRGRLSPTDAASVAPIKVRALGRSTIVRRMSRLRDLGVKSLTV